MPSFSKMFASSVIATGFFILALLFALTASDAWSDNSRLEATLEAGLAVLFLGGCVGALNFGAKP